MGGGQNIYNFAYYGLYDPLYILGWLFPFIPMELWFQILGAAAHFSDGVLGFLWLKRHTGEKEGFAGAMIIMLSAAVVYHTFAQVMFVNYLPFFLLMLIGADIRKVTGKGTALTLGTIGMILTSFYFAPACMAALGIWILTGTQKEGRTVWKYIKSLFWQVFPALFGVLLSSFYLAPVFCALLGGRSGGGGVSWKELFLPDFNAEKYLYSPYGLGLTGLAVIILCIWLFAGKCRERRAAVLLSAVFVFPVFPWLLNGGLYARSKVFVPFLPLMSFLCARFFEGLGAKMENLRSCAAAKDVGTERNGNRRFTRESLIFGYIAGAFVLILGSGDLSRKGEALAIFADLLLCGAGLLFISAGSKADSLTCPGLCQMLRWFSIHLPAAGSLTVWKKRNRERRRQNFAVLLTICTMAVVCVVEIMGTQNTRVSRQELAEIYDADVRESVRSLLAGEARPVRLEVRGSRSYEKANQNRVLVPGQNLTTCYSSFENAAYTRFRKNIGLVRYTRNCLMQDAQNNPLFLRFMGVKYLVGGKKVPGWEKIKGDGASAVYRNDRTAPLSYLTDQTISSETFESLSWQEKQIVLLEAAAVPEKDGTQEKLPAERQRKEGGEAGRHPAERKVTIQETQNENGLVISKGDGFRIKADKEVKTEAVLDQKTQKGDYVFLSFRVENHRPSKDVTVTVNGVRNKLSSTATEYYNGNEVFHYTLALPEGTQRLSISFGAGDYEIRKLACCVGQVDEAKNGTLYANPADLQLSTSGNGYTGAIQAEEDQWLITSIPYDKSLSIYVDGICLKTESVNGGFAGA